MPADHLPSSRYFDAAVPTAWWIIFFWAYLSPTSTLRPPSVLYYYIIIFLQRRFFLHLMTYTTRIMYRGTLHAPKDDIIRQTLGDNDETILRRHNIWTTRRTPVKQVTLNQQLYTADTYTIHSCYLWSIQVLKTMSLVFLHIFFTGYLNWQYKNNNVKSYFMTCFIF